MNSVITHFVISGDNLIATIYRNDVYGKIIVFRESSLNVKDGLTLAPAYGSGESEDKGSILDLVMSVMPT